MTKRTERSPQHDKNKMPRPPKIPVKRRLLPEDETDTSTKKYSTKKQKNDIGCHLSCLRRGVRRTTNRGLDCLQWTMWEMAARIVHHI